MEYWTLRQNFEGQGLYNDSVTDLVHSSHNTRGTITVGTLISAASKTLSVHSEKHSFVKQMESEPGFEDIITFPQRLTTPALLDLGRWTWIERTGNTAICILPRLFSHLTEGVFIAKVFYVSTVSTYHQRVEKALGKVWNIGSARQR
jgi:hypothetical protein